MWRREILAGLSTFFTMSYLLLLYPQILSAGGIDLGAALTATILVIVSATFFLALYADFPAVLTPGLSVGPYLIYSIVLEQHASWQTALGIVFWVGFILFLLTLFKVRQKIICQLPPSIKASAISGIGLFLICVALKNLNILAAPFTLENGVALLGLILFYILHRFRWASSFLLSILTCWILGLLLHLATWKGFAALPAPLAPTLFQLDLATSIQPQWIGALISVLLISLFDSTASITILARLSHKADSRNHIPNLNRILTPDGTGSMLAALLGTGTLSYALESSSGIKAGGRTGITAITAALCCLICLFFYPLISSIPPFATAPALIAIGLFMTFEAKFIQWKEITEAIPAAITLATIPITFSIYYGFALGFTSYTLLKILSNRRKEVHPICWILSLIFALHLIVINAK